MLTMNGHVSQWNMSKAVSKFNKVNGTVVPNGVPAQNNVINCDNNMTFKEIVNINRTQTTVTPDAVMTSESHDTHVVNGISDDVFVEETATEEDYLLDVDKEHVSNGTRSRSRNSRASDSSIEGLTICYYKLK